MLCMIHFYLYWLYSLIENESYEMKCNTCVGSPNKDLLVGIQQPKSRLQWETNCFLNDTWLFFIAHCVVGFTILISWCLSHAYDVLSVTANDSMLMPFPGSYDINLRRQYVTRFISGQFHNNKVNSKPHSETYKTYLTLTL